MIAPIDAATLGRAVQGAAAALVAVLFFVLGRGGGPRFQRFWGAGWGALAIARLPLVLGGPAAAAPGAWALRFFELVFVFAVWLGARELGGRPAPRRTIAAGLAGLAAVTALPTLFSAGRGAGNWEGVSGALPAQAAVLAVAYAAAAVAAGKILFADSRLGQTLLASSLWLLSALALAEGAATTLGVGSPAASRFLSYSPFPELLLQFLAAFAMLLCRAEAEQRRQSAFHSHLASAHRELVNTYAMLRDESERDALTDAYNRTAFDRFLGAGSAALNRGSVAVIDMNELKTINDRNGHAVGDRALQLLADAIRGLFRLEDPLFRWGGDEFLLLLRHGNANDARGRLDRLNRLLANSWDGPAPVPQAAWGVEPFSSLEDFPRALKRADAAMYESKRAFAPSGAA